MYACKYSPASIRVGQLGPGPITLLADTSPLNDEMERLSTSSGNREEQLTVGQAVVAGMV